MDCSPPGSSVHELLQARILEWAASSFSRGSSRPRDRTCVSYIGRQIFFFFATEPPGKPLPTRFLVYFKGCKSGTIRWKRDREQDVWEGPKSPHPLCSHALPKPPQFTKLEALQNPAFRLFIEASLHGDDWLNHCLFGNWTPAPLLSQKVRMEKEWEADSSNPLITCLISAPSVCSSMCQMPTCPTPSLIMTSCPLSGLDHTQRSTQFQV